MQGGGKVEGQDVKMIGGEGEAQKLSNTPGTLALDCEHVSQAEEIDRPFHGNFESFRLNSDLAE